MIVNCEQCHARYLLASLLLGSAGRKVRCGVCGHTWFQEPTDTMLPPDQDDSIADFTPSFADQLASQNMQPIPEGVLPIPEGSSVPAVPGPAMRKHEAIATGIVAVLAFFAIFMMLAMFRSPLTEMWPPSARVFDIVGMDTTIPGDGLVFDKIEADIDAKGNLRIKGNIINTYDKPVRIPMIEAMASTGKNPEKIWEVSVDKSVAAPEETMSFTTNQAAVMDTVTDVTVRFKAQTH